MPIDIDCTQRDHARVTFSLDLADAPAAVSVVGNFNDWTPGANELEEDDAGRKAVTVAVPYGEELHFRYLAEDGRWFDDPDLPSVDGDGAWIKALQPDDESERTDDEGELS